MEFDNLDEAKAAVGPQTAGFLVEPIQGEGGVRIASQAFIEGLRALCDEHDLMLAFDEVQCGVGRIGRTSYVASTALFIDGTCIGVCDTVLVALGENGPEPLTEEFRAALQTVLMSATDL